MDDGGVQQPDDSRTRSVEYSAARGGYVCNRCRSFSPWEFLAPRESTATRVNEPGAPFAARSTEARASSVRRSAWPTDGRNRNLRVASSRCPRRLQSSKPSRCAASHPESPSSRNSGPLAFVRAEQIRRRKFRVPGTARAIGMAIEARVRENFLDLRVCREAIRRGRSKHHRCGIAAIRAFGNQSRFQKRERDTGRKKGAPDFVFRDQTMHRSLSRYECIVWRSSEVRC